MPVKDIHYEDSYDQALSDAGDNLVIVAFFNAWSEACKWVPEAIEALNKRFPDALFLKVDIDQTDENEDVADKEDITDVSVPAFKFYKRRQPAADGLKSATRDKLEEVLRTLLPAN